MTARRRLGLVTTARADYSSIRPLLRRIEDHEVIEPVLFCAGMHLMAEFGNTRADIIADGFHIDEDVPIFSGGDSREALGKSLGAGVTAFTDAFARQKPDIVLVVGDRVELMCAALAALVLDIPIAHVSGGDITDGAFDNQIRHALTKMAHLHFVSLPEHERRVLQMGEEPWRVALCGEPALDGIPELATLDRGELGRSLGMELKPPVILVTYHPATLGRTPTEIEGQALFAALAQLNARFIITYPNVDPGHRTVVEQIRSFVAGRADAVAVQSLGPQRYYSLLAVADAMIGNSSSGIWESASFRLPVVNVGERQEGRLRARNVIDVAGDRAAIEQALKQALSGQFRDGLRDLVNPYGDGRACGRILARLETVPLGVALLKKRFVDMD